jgi:hypothetical protein
MLLSSASQPQRTPSPKSDMEAFQRIMAQTPRLSMGQMNPKLKLKALCRSRIQMSIKGKDRLQLLLKFRNEVSSARLQNKAQSVKAKS